VKKSVMEFIGPYFDIIKERKKKGKKGNLDSQHCMLSWKKGKIFHQGLHQ
jgi:hypothetical protein